MFDDLKAYYQRNVVASYSEYRDVCSNGTTGRGHDLRSALIAASALFHLRKHLPSCIPSRAEVERDCSDYALLGDVVNASKHKVLSGQTPHGTPLITGADKLFEQLELTEYKDEVGFYQHVQKVVIARLSDGTEHNLIEILTNVLNFWERHLCTIGAIAVARVFTHDCAVRYRTRIECEANDLNFEGASGEPLSRPMRLFRFDTAILLRLHKLTQLVTNLQPRCVTRYITSTSL